MNFHAKHLDRGQFGVALFLFGVACSSLAQAQTESFGKLVSFDPAFYKIIAEDTTVEVLARGFSWSEGPVWVDEAGESYLLFSDVPKNVVHKWSEKDGLSQYLKPSGYTGPLGTNGQGSNGLALDGQGRLVSCEHGDRRLSVLTKSGGKMTLADRFEGKRFNSPNDLAIKSNGEIYFTDPPYGLPRSVRKALKELDFQGIFRLRPDGEVTLMSKALEWPNGIAFSPDEKVLYVSNSNKQKPFIYAFDVKSDGILSEPRVFVSFEEWAGVLPGSQDGLKVDAQGTIFATGPGGVYVITPRGEILGRVETGSTANLGWGDDGGTLYITAGDKLCRVRTLTRGPDSDH